MLSIHPVTRNVKAATDYYLRQEFTNMPSELQAQALSAWFGEGAEHLHLRGEVTATAFAALLDGQLPNGVQLGIIKNGKRQHRPGFDLTFNAPKSLSILALLGGHWHLLTCHQDATKYALGEVERLCAQARKTVSGETHYENTENLTIALFPNFLSRAGEPHVHTHSVVLNDTLRDDKHWRALASHFGLQAEPPQGFYERVIHFQRYFGLIYHAKLASLLTARGVAIRKTHADGRFELACVPDDVCKAFSSRRSQIEAHLAEHGQTGSKAAALAAVITREQLTPTRDYSAHLDDWQVKASAHDFDAANSLSIDKALSAKQQAIPSTHEQLIARDALAIAIEQASLQTLTLNQVQLMNLACQFAFPAVPAIDTLLSVIDEACQRGELIPLPKVSGSLPSYTTRHQINQERALLALLDAGNQVKQPLATLRQAREFFAAHEVFPQTLKPALTQLLREPARFVAVTGNTSSRKYQLLPHLQDFCKVSEQRLFVLSQKRQDCDYIARQFKVHTATLASIVNTLEYQLEKTQGRLNGRDCVFVITHAEQLPFDLIKQVMQVTSRIGAKLLFFADTNRSPPGLIRSPLLQLLQHQCPTIALSPALANKSATSLAVDVDKLNLKLIEVSDKTQCRQALIAGFVSAYRTIKPNLTVSALVTSRAGVRDFNQGIHNRLVGERQLGSTTVSVDILSRHYLSPVQMRQARFYQPGLWLHFKQENLEFRIDVGDYWQVAGVDRRQQQLSLVNKRGQTRLWSLAMGAPDATIFKGEQRTFNLGERIRWQYTQAKKRLASGEMLWVTDIKDHKLTLLRGNGKSVTVDTRKLANRHLDYGYAITSWQSTVEPFTHILAYQAGSQTNHGAAFFYECARLASKSLTLFTEDKKVFANQLTTPTQAKTSAVDLLLNPNSVIKPQVRNPQQTLASIQTAVVASIQSITNTKVKSSSPLPAVYQQAQQGLSFAIAHLSQHEAVFTGEELLQHALSHVLGRVTPAQMKMAVSQLGSDARLLRGQAIGGQVQWTTPAAKLTEKAIINQAMADKKVLPLLRNERGMQQFLQQSTLNEQQRDAIVTLMRSTCVLNFIQGFAGVGKTTLLKGLADLLFQDYKISPAILALKPRLHGIAPTHEAVRALQKNGIPAQTLASFLSQPALSGKFLPTDIKHPTIFILDEASMVASSDFLMLQERCKQGNARLIVIGDKQQLPAIEAGKPFALLQETKTPVIHLSEMVRQQDLVLKTAALACAHGKFARAFNLLADVVIEGKDGQSPISALVSHYLACSLEKRQHTQIITPAHKHRRAINEAIREGLHKEGFLSGAALEANILIKQPRSNAQLQHIDVGHYDKGDIIYLYRGDKLTSRAARAYFTVEALDIKQQTLTLQDSDKHIFLFKPTQSHRLEVEIFKREERCLQVGDEIRFTRSDKATGLFSGQSAGVLAIAGKQVSLRLADKRQVSLDFGVSRHQHWDYAYAATTHAVQGQTIDHVLVLFDSRQRRLTTQKNFYTALTRARLSAMLFTDDKANVCYGTDSNASRG